MNNLKFESLRIEQPKGLKIKLKEHQKSSIHAMKELETTGEIKITINSAISSRGIIQLKEDSLVNDENIFNNNYWYHSWYSRNNGNFKEIEYMINTNFGILSDKVGSGKTLMIVGLIVESLIPPNNPKNMNSTQFTSLKYIDSTIAIKTNLILIPHNLTSQWFNAFKDNTRLKVKLIHRQSVLDSIKSVYNINCDELDIIPEQTLEYYDVVIVTSSMASDFFDLYKHTKWARIIIDEVLSIKLPADIPWQANFIWFITATPSGLAYIKKLYIRDIFTSLQKIVFNYLVIKNNDSYVSTSMNLPSLNQILIHCLTPKAISMIKNFVSDEIMNMLNAGNISEAITRINCNADTDDNIFKVITSKLEKEIHNKKAELAYQMTIIPSDAKIHEEIIKKIKEKITSLEQRQQSMEEKLKTYKDESCPICLEDFVNPALMKCCTSLFCMGCLTKVCLDFQAYDSARAANRKCPMCRAPFELSDLNVIIKDIEKIKKTKVEDQLLTKQLNLVNIINKKPDGKFLIFSCYENTNDSLAKVLKDNNIKFSKLLGSCGAINNIIDRFNSSDINVLLLNAQHYGSGLNLQMATDIIIYHEMNQELETQIIGRAQRIGRTDSLNVYYLLYDNEKHNVTNPSLDLSIYDPNDNKLVDFITGTRSSSEINLENKGLVNEFWDSDEEELFKRAEAKRLLALKKIKAKELKPKRKTTKKTDNIV